MFQPNIYLDKQINKITLLINQFLIGSEQPVVVLIICPIVTRHITHLKEQSNILENFVKLLHFIFES